MNKFQMYTLDPQCKLEYAKAGDSGADFRAHIPTAITLRPGERTLVPTGVFVQMPPGYELQVRPRSGLALKSGITVVNSPGTIDSCYRGEIGIIILNTDKSNDFTINPFDKIAQAVVSTVFHPEWNMVSPKEELSETERGDGGFGSTGVAAQGASA